LSVPEALSRSQEQQNRAVANSLNFGRSISGVQVGYAGVATELATFAWLCDVYVDPAGSGKGLGTALAAAVRDDLAPYGLGRILLAAADAHSVYGKIGFVPLAKPEKWMARCDQSSAVPGGGAAMPCPERAWRSACPTFAFALESCDHNEDHLNT
jgi:hypothetical protein